MKVQVFKAHNININGFGGAAIYHKDFPDRAFIFINMDLSPEEQQKIYDDISLIVRKCAHFAEYTLLGLILRFCLESWFGQRFRSVYPLSLISFAGSVIYAGTDELHQLMIDGRSGQFTDVLVDSCGALTGIILGTLLIARSGARKRDGG